MFEYDIKELKFYNESKSKDMYTQPFNCEPEVSREDKIAFVDSMQDGKLSYILSLIEKFKKEEPDLPHDKYNHLKTVSLKAWVSRYNEMESLFTGFDYGTFSLYGLQRNIKNPNAKLPYDVYSDLVDEAFHKQLEKCSFQERNYFLEHDEYSILKTKFFEQCRRYDTTFDAPLVYSARENEVKVHDETAKFERNITIDELKDLLSKYNQLDELIKKLSKETHIVY